MSNPTYFVDFSNRSLVLRKKPDVQLSASAHRIDREYRLLEALAPTSVPVPQPLLFGEDESLVGTAFYVMERLQGTVFDSYALPGLTPEVRSRCFNSLAETLAAIHQVDWQSRGLADFGRPGNYFERQLGGWEKQWAGFAGLAIPEIDRLLVWLRSAMPEDDGIATIAHGDYRIANVMFAEDGRASGVFDWELATIGHPLADVGFCLQGWLLAPDQNGGIAGLDLAPLGIPSARAFVEAYHRAAPEMPELQAFHIAFAMFRAAVGVSGVAVRAQTRGDDAGWRQARQFAHSYACGGLEAIESWK